MKITLRGVRTAASLVLAVAALGACTPTGSPRCDAYPAPIAVATSIGYKTDCTPPADWQVHLGWSDHDTHTNWIWAYRISDDRVLHFVMWHEDGHAWNSVHHQTNTEQTADWFAWCRMKPAERLSFQTPPPSCAPYL